MSEDAKPVDEIQEALDQGFKPSDWWMINDKEGNTLDITRTPNDFLFFRSLVPKDVEIFRVYVRNEVKWIKESPKA